jgi:hypothetical protein
LALVAPLTQGTGLLSASFVVQRSIAWYAAKTRLWGVDFGANYNSLAAVLTMAGMATLAWTLARGRPPGLAGPAAAAPARVPAAPSVPTGPASPGWTLRRPPVAPAAVAAAPRAPAPRAPARRLVGALIGLLLVAIVACDAAAFRPAPLLHRAGAIGVVQAAYVGGATDLRLRATPAPGQETMRLVTFPVLRPPEQPEVRVFVDPRYPGPDSTARGVLGVLDHVRAELRVRQDTRPVSAVDVGGLEATLRDVAAAHGMILVMMTGSWPAEVFSRDLDLVSPWIGAGGTLVWGGDEIGYYSVHQSVNFDPRDPASLRDGGPSRLLGADVVDPGKVTGRNGDTPTDLARALNLEFQSTAVGVLIDPLTAAGGRVLGFTGAGYSSISVLPVGRGRVVIFAGDTYNEIPIAHDLSLLLLSGVFSAAGDVSYTDVSQARLGQGGDVLWNPDTHDQRGSRVLVAFDPAPEGVFFTSLLFSPSG